MCSLISVFLAAVETSGEFTVGSGRFADGLMDNDSPLLCPRPEAPTWLVADTLSYVGVEGSVRNAHHLPRWMRSEWSGPFRVSEGEGWSLPSGLPMATAAKSRHPSGTHSRSASSASPRKVPRMQAPSPAST